MNGTFNIVVNAERQRSLAYLETRRVALIIDTTIITRFSFYAMLESWCWLSLMSTVLHAKGIPRPIK